MVREKVSVSTRTLQWKCVESRIDNKRLLYGRFILSPLIKGQADTIGIAMRRALLGEIEGTCITRVKSEKASHEYSTIGGIQESVHDILMNLKEIVLSSNLYGTSNAFISIKGPQHVTAKDIILPPHVQIIDSTQHIAWLTEPVDLCIGLKIERNRGYFHKVDPNFDDESYPIDAVFMPVRNVNHSIHSYGNQKKEILFLEIWTNGSLTPKEALHEAARILIDFFIPFFHMEEENFYLADAEHTISLSPALFYDKVTQLIKNNKKLLLKSIFIDQLEFPPKIYNCLKNSNIFTLFDLFTNKQEDLLKIEHFHREDVKQILGILGKYFALSLPKT
uniref:DNA-directed RNA polymerase subunit alpha n=1 Tax=Cuscuta pedicellata TaxID=192827 RepID=A0A7H0DH10_9ASTE|nr:RNA polymerase alpha subunit [Cuscuta pedicellata]QNP08620.1 RNA polymerase alpha subunit [Cuscuta pedicellata]